MPADAPIVRNEDRDALHILPLALLDFETKPVMQARLIKNSRLESVVELFSGQGMGSGQMEVDHLQAQFGWSSNPPHKDLRLLRKLAKLPSYDVYSLRILFREQGVDMKDMAALTLSDEKKAELTDYMRVFTQPLIQQIYGGDDVDISTFGDVVGLFKDPDIKKVRNKLQTMSKKLGIEIQDVPLFLEDYGDVFLSLSYYRQCMEKLEPQIDDFLESLTEIRGNFQLKQNLNLMETCDTVEYTMNSMMAAIAGRFETFERYTTAMWENIDAVRFRQMKNFIEDYHVTIGGTLCAVTVKMAAWSRLFPNKDTGGPARRAEFINGEMKQGIEVLQEIEAKASKIEKIDFG